MRKSEIDMLVALIVFVMGLAVIGAFRVYQWISA